MATYGLTSSGFVAEPLAQVNADIIAAFQAQFGADIDTSPTGPFGQLAGILAEREALLWSMGQAVYGAAYPDTASGSALDDVCALTGVVRLQPTKSTDTVVCIGTATTVVPAGTLFATATSGVQFASNANATIATLAAYATSVAYAVGALVTNAGNVYSCTGAITSSTTAPTGTGSSIVDGTGTWRYCGAGAAAVAVACSGNTTGPLTAPAGTITVISTPVAGLTTVLNPLDAVVGTNIETDAALRTRRASLLTAAGKSPVSSLQAALLKVAGVTGAVVIENPLDTTDASSRPPHSFESVVQGGTDAAVATAIWNNKAAGIQTYGTYTPQTVVDPVSGVSYTIKMTRPTQVPIYVAVTLKKGTAYAGDTAVVNAVIAWANGTAAAAAGVGVNEGPFAIGQTVYSSPILAALLDSTLGILDVTSVFIGTSASPTTSTPVTLTYAQLATFNSANVTVVSS